MLGNKQRTIAKSFTIKGIGLHTSAEVTTTFHPAEENYGYRFIRTDLEKNIEIPALSEYVVNTERSTVLEKDGVKVQTVEHLLSALYGCEIDNCKIEINAQEPPILDGSAKYFVDEIIKAGIHTQDAERDFFIVEEPITVKNSDTNSEITLLPDTDFKIDTHISFEGSHFLTNQYAQLHDLSTYKDEIAHCRTFVFLRELEVLLKNNLVKGGSLDNAIVIMDKEIPQADIDRLANLFKHETKVIKEIGVISNEPLRYSNEPARHKLLDVIGDLALCGKFIKGRIIATRPGHSINTSMAKNIRRILKKSKAPNYDPADVPLLDINQIKKLLPHRYPFLLVDKVIYLCDNKIVGIKNVTTNENFFMGHFEDEPVMPGVLIVESLAQCGGLLVMQDKDEPERYSTYFMKIDDFRFKRKVVPGDTLVLSLEILQRMKRGIINMRGEVYVGNKKVAEGILIAQVIKNK